LTEYIFNYMFYQDGNIELEIRLTGIVQVYAEDPKKPSESPFATTVAPGVSAQYHQHMFSVRVDPMIDGLFNTVVETDIVPVAAPTGSALNHAGNGFTTKSFPIATQRDGARDFELQTDRRWAITNPGRRHPVTGKPTGYTIMGKGGITPLMARPDSWVATRARWAEKALWVVKDVEGPKGSRVWPSGKYMPGSREENPDSVTKWVQEDENLDGEDVLLYLTMGELQ
jgi:primary-amine oxidase